MPSVNTSTTPRALRAPPPKPLRRDLLFLVELRPKDTNLGLEVEQGQLDLAAVGRIVKGRGRTYRRRTDGVCFIVKEVVIGSAAARDGRLHPGDEILEINGQLLEKITLEKVRLVL